MQVSQSAEFPLFTVAQLGIPPAIQEVPDIEGTKPAAHEVQIPFDEQVRQLVSIKLQRAHTDPVQ